MIAERRGIGIYMTAAHRLDGTELAAGITRQTRMRYRVDISCLDLVTGFEFGRRRRRALEIPPSRRVRHISRSQLAVEPSSGSQCSSGLDLVRADKAVRGDAFFEPEKPTLVIGRREVGNGRQHFHGGTAGVDRP